MSKKRTNRKPIKIAAHYMLIDGKKVEIDPYKTDLPDRCKLALAEMGWCTSLRGGE
nr:adenylosuccinate synthetase [Brevibacillus laterosporus]